MRVIFDTNVFVSGIFWQGNFCSQLIDKWINKRFELVISKEILDELIKTLKSFKIQMPDEMIVEWTNIILRNSIIVEPKIRLDVIKEDADDNKFLEAGVTGDVNFIISQDKHLLNLKKYEGIEIISPEEAVRVIE